MLRLNGVEIKPTIFPDKTSQVWHITNLNEIVYKETRTVITWDFESEAEFMHLAQLRHLLSEISPPVQFVDLYLSYLPYGRQDKTVSNESTFALRTFGEMLYALHFSKIYCMDPHSNMLEGFTGIGRIFWPIYPHRAVKTAYSSTGSDLVCYPDNGAVTKYTKVYGFPHIYGEKVRDQATGKITHYQVIGNCEGKTVLIVDDICDGGMTFKILAKDLLAGGAKEVNLFVTHGIFSKGLETLRESGIKRIFTQNGER